MAEWGKGDPRWIVEERSDGKNCNAWHWEEKDCTKWCRERLEELVKNVHLSTSDASVALTKVSKLEGEITWYNRKGKLFTLYDLTLGLDFTGTRGDDAISGTVKITDFEQDGESDATFRVTVGSGSPDDTWKRWARDELKKSFLSVWSQLIVELHADQKSKSPALNKPESGKIKLPDMVQKAAPLADKVATGSPSGTVNISLVFQASPQDLYDIFVNLQKVQHFTQAPAMVDAKEGGFFQLYDGVITGCFIELKPYTELRFAWRLKDWKEGVNSQVSIKFTKASSGTKLELAQTNVPSDDVERTRQGWTRYYFERWRGVFGYSYV